MSEVLTSLLPLVIPLSMGGLGGFFVGYTVKKVYRFAFTIGAFVLLVAYMAHVSVINLNLSGLAETVSTLVATFFPLLNPLTSSLMFMGSFMVGLMYGLTKG